MIFPETFPVFHTPRLVLRPMTEQDADAIFAIFSHPEVMRYWDSLPMTDPQKALDLILRAQADFLKQSAFRWGISLPENDLVIGTFSLFKLDGRNRHAEIGYILGRPYWGKGYMQESLSTVIAYAFDELEFLRLEADIDPRNDASTRALERQGFQREGLLRERWIVGEEITDSLIMGVLKREWAGRRGSAAL